MASFDEESSLLYTPLEYTSAETTWSMEFFPRMTKNTLIAYSRYCRANVKSIAVLPIFMLGCVFWIFRMIGNPVRNPLFQISFASLSVAFVIFMINISPLLLRRCLSNPYFANKMENNIIHLRFRLEDLLMICNTCMYGFNIMGRVVAGTCPEDVTFWESQTCTSLHDSIPSELVMLMYLSPIIYIHIIGNLTVTGLIITWFMTIGFITFCIIYSQAWTQLWMLFTSLFFICMTLTAKRDKRIAFLRLVEIAEQRKLALTHLQNQHAAETALAEQRRVAEVASVTATNERNLRVSETQQLRNLMGNVAHDLKTPLFSVEADIELLKLLFNAIPPQAMQMASTSLSSRSHGQKVDYDPATIFDSLWSTCRFMIAAINRGQDFAKASMNIALTPNQGISIYLSLS